MSRARDLMDRLREERRVRRDFERLMTANGLADGDPDLEDERPKRRWVRKGPWWWASRGVVALVAVLCLLAASVLLTPIPYDPPAPLQTAFVYDQEGRLIARLDPGEDRVVVPLRRIPGILQSAVLAAEDQRFYEHPGVDLMAVGRAAWTDLTGGRFQGGSTITQQLVRSTDRPYVGREVTLSRKLQEAVAAIRLERRFSKDEILELYLNQIYLGEGAYGVEAAAREYFGRHVWNLRLREAAVLAGVIAAPSRFNPRADPGAATIRRDYVLGRMAQLGMIPAERAERVAARPIDIVPARPRVSRAAYFVDHVTEEVVERYGQDVLDRGGVRIETTLDLDLQRAAQDAVAAVSRGPRGLDAALVAVDVETGGILAMVGGTDFRLRGQFNLATQGRRQAGSAFKPFVLTQALREGISPYKVYAAPSSTWIGGWNVSNYGGSSYGAMTVRSATLASVNTVYAQLIRDVGPQDVADLARRMGIRSPLSVDATLTLGTSEVTPLEMTAAYATLAAGGMYRSPTGLARVVDGTGEVLGQLRSDRGRRAVPEDVTTQVTSILRDTVNQGTGTGARIPGVEVAGKTGTTDDHADAWFCGYTAEVAACVWVGHREARIDTGGITGGSLPASVWRSFMTAVPLPDGALPSDGGGTSSTYVPSEPGAEGEAPEGQEPGDPGEAPPEEPPASPPPDDGGGGGGIIPPIFPPGGG